MKKRLAIAFVLALLASALFAFAGISEEVGAQRSDATVWEGAAGQEVLATLPGMEAQADGSGDEQLAEDTPDDTTEAGTAEDGKATDGAAEAKPEEVPADDAIAENSHAEVADAEEMNDSAVPAFDAEVVIRLVTGTTELNGSVTLAADVRRANMDHEIHWDMQDPVAAAKARTEEELEKTWIRIGTGTQITFVLDEQNLKYSYRITLVASNGEEIHSEPVSFSASVESAAQAGPAASENEMPGEASPEMVAEDPAVDEAETPADGEAAPDADKREDKADTSLGTGGPIDATEAAEGEEAGLAPVVFIISDREQIVSRGETITLTGTAMGFGDGPLSYQWECDRGAGFEPIEGANEPQYTFAATAESLTWNWRLTVIAE